MMFPLISVVIPTFNRSQLLLSCLESLSRQRLPHDLFEVIVVNDGSLDSTLVLVEAFKENTSLNIEILTHENHGVSFSRNRGINSSKGQIIAFTDDDCLVPPDWLSKIKERFELLEENIAGIGGPLDSFTDNPDSLVGRFITYLDEFNYVPVLGRLFIRPVYITRLRTNIIVPYLRTSNAAFRKEHLDRVGGFDPEFTRPGGEDPDLCYRLLAAGYSFEFARDIVVRHHTRENFRVYFRSLKNYVHGEFRKSKKRDFYVLPVIKRSYSLIPLQKAVSLLLSLLFYPVNVVKSYRAGVKVVDAFFFPLVIAFSKQYVFFYALAFQLESFIDGCECSQKK